MPCSPPHPAKVVQKRTCYFNWQCLENTPRLEGGAWLVGQPFLPPPSPERIQDVRVWKEVWFWPFSTLGRLATPGMLLSQQEGINPGPQGGRRKV